MIAPALSTSRLILRAQRREDFVFYAATRADAAYMRYMADGAPNSEEQAWASFLRMAGQWAMSGFGSWMVEEKSSGALVGNVGFIDRKRDRGPEFKDIVEMGWGVAPAHAGKGYASEAVGAAIGWGHAHLGPIRVIAIVAPGNDASVRVAEKCGFARQPDIASVGRSRMLFDRIL